MGMRPADFWSMSFKEWVLALQGFIEFNTPVSSNGAFSPLTKNDPEWKKLMKDDPNARK